MIPGGIFITIYITPRDEKDGHVSPSREALLRTWFFFEFGNLFAVFFIYTF